MHGSRERGRTEGGRRSDWFGRVSESAELSRHCSRQSFRRSGSRRCESRPIVYFDGERQAGPLSVRKALAGKHVMLIGVTGFIGKVWLANTLMDLPEIGRIYLLIRRQKSNPAQRRFEKMVEESPVFDPLFERYGAGLARFLRGARGSGGRRCFATGPGAGAGGVGSVCRTDLDLIINSSGLTDFNPDLRDALADECGCGGEHCGVCSQVGSCGAAASFDLLCGGSARWASERDAASELHAGWRAANFDAEQEWRALHEFVKRAERRRRARK